MRIIVTGSEGYIGRGLMDRLSTFDEFEVLGVDEKKNGMVELFEPPWEPDVTVHLAAVTNIAELEQNPSLIHKNVRATEAVMEWGRGRVIFTSSSAIYGPTWHAPEDMPPNPQSEYAAQKLKEEIMLGKRPNSVILRLFQVVGQSNRSVDSPSSGHLLPCFAEYGKWPSPSTISGSSIHTNVASLT